MTSPAGSRAVRADSAVGRSGAPAVGCDVVSVRRLAAALRRPGFAARVFTDRELADARRGGVDPGGPVAHRRLAARFAAKEAARKALGELDRHLHSTEVRTRADGAPRLWVDGRPSALALSLTHDAGVAMAVVVGPPPTIRE